MRLPKKIRNQIIETIEKDMPLGEGFYGDLHPDSVNHIIKYGLSSFIDEVYDMNREYMEYKINTYLWNLFVKFEQTIIDYNRRRFSSDYSDYALSKILFIEFVEEFREHILIDLDFRIPLLNVEVTCIITVHSNFDASFSQDTLENSNYLSQVYSRVKKGVKRQDLINEHRQGKCNEGLFCFIFNTNLKTALDLRNDFPKYSKIFIPKGTRFGFYSIPDETASNFDSMTYRDMMLPIAESSDDYCYLPDGNIYYYKPDYDNLSFTIDNPDDRYSLNEIFGCTDWIGKADVDLFGKIKQEVALW